jgi:hypothetical protein
MKKYFLLLLLAALGCTRDEPADELSVLAREQCTYADRRTVGTLTNRAGVVKITPSGSDKWVDIFLDDDATTPYCPCNLPTAYARQGQRVEFSAELKETLPNERWRCQPVVLTALRKRP